MDDSEWLEIKSTIQILKDPSDEAYNYLDSMEIIYGDYVMEDGYSKIFGGKYDYCVFFDDGVCLDTIPEGNMVLSEWSIIYRIHNV